MECRSHAPPSSRGLFLRLELFPLLEHGFGRAGRAALATARQRAPIRLKDVRMAPDEFVDNGLDRIRDVEAAALRGDLRVEHALEQHITEFASEVIEVAPVDRIQRS